MSEILIERLQDAVREMTRTELLSLCWEAADALTVAEARIAELERKLDPRLSMIDDLQRVIETSERISESGRDKLRAIVDRLSRNTEDP